MKSFKNKTILVLVAMVFAVGAGENQPSVEELEQRYFNKLTLMLGMQQGGECPVEDKSKCLRSTGRIVKEETERFFDKVNNHPSADAMTLQRRVRDSLETSACLSHIDPEDEQQFKREMRKDENLSAECSKFISKVDSYRDVLSLLLQHYKTTEVKQILYKMGLVSMPNTQVFAPFVSPLIIYEKPQYTQGETISLRVRFFSELIYSVSSKRIYAELPEDFPKDDPKPRVIRDRHGRVKYKGSVERYQEWAKREALRNTYDLEVKSNLMLDNTKGDLEVYANLVTDRVGSIKLKTVKIFRSGNLEMSVTDEGEVLKDHKGDPRYGYYYDAVFDIPADKIGTFSLSNLSIIYTPAEGAFVYADRMSLEEDRYRDIFTVVPAFNMTAESIAELEAMEREDVAKGSTVKSTYLKFEKTDELAFRITTDATKKRVYLSRCKQMTDLSYDCAPLFDTYKGYYTFDDIMMISQNLQALYEHKTYVNRAMSRDLYKMVSFLNSHIDSYMTAAMYVSTAITADAAFAAFSARYGPVVMEYMATRSATARLNRGLGFILALAGGGAVIYYGEKVAKKWMQKLEGKVGGVDEAVFHFRELLEKNEDKEEYDQFIRLYPEAMESFLDALESALEGYEEVLKEQLRQRQLHPLYNPCSGPPEEMDDSCWA
ncbi:MAG: hypothetical protein CL677_00215 [Bdellovibrionaceae bacterium]|nr:hypothetical protein [Pseudobdellovibrionaceae bacterium]